ncbi:polyamine aminopropyltransferase [Neisseria sp. Ec49-e6-T10]|uniref:polyamine aminopropyltransferase n=1 Tax=Neisseria sp. Ec49-e6-T10 TaxID=3140744 RepID=UPI003EBD5F07
MSNRVLIISVFIVASCGLAYELIASALSSYLLGDSILQFSSIIGCYLFAMGIGSHLSKYVKDKDVLARFIDIELLVGLIGGISALFLFVVFAWAAAPFRTVLYALVLIIGTLVGMEIPLVMRIFHLKEADFKELVSKVLTFDYLGALAVSLLFPLVLAPQLGMSRTALLFGLLNALVALVTLHIFRKELTRFYLQQIRALMVIFALTIAFSFSNKVTTWSEQAFFGDPITYTASTPYQRIVLTTWKDDTRLFLNGNLQFSSRDEHRYHEALVLPAMQAAPFAKNILLLGAGDGLAARELLKYPRVEKITLVDLDPAMTQLFRTSAALTKLNENALNNPKVQVINADAGKWLEEATEVYDLIIIDLPDPSNFALGKLYSVPMYSQVSRHLSENGYVVVQSTSPYFAPHAYWCVVETLKAAGFYTWPYHAYVPSFGEWGFVLASKHNRFSLPKKYDVPTRFLNEYTTQLMFEFPPDMNPPKVEPNYLNTQSLVHYFEQDWQNTIR